MQRRCPRFRHRPRPRHCHRHRRHRSGGFYIYCYKGFCKGFFFSVVFLSVVFRFSGFTKNKMRACNGFFFSVVFLSVSTQRVTGGGGYMAG